MTATVSFQFPKRKSFRLIKQKGGGRACPPFYSMTKAHIRTFAHLHNENYTDELGLVGYNTAVENLVNAIIIQAYNDYKRGDKEALTFLQNCELGRKVLEEEERIYGERK